MKELFTLENFKECRKQPSRDAKLDALPNDFRF